MAEWLEKRRKEAERAFNDLPVLELKYGIGIEIDTSSLMLDEDRQCHSELTISEDENIEVITWEKAIGLKESKELFFSTISPKKKLFYYHVMNVRNGALIRVKKKCSVKTPVTITTLLKGRSHDHLLIICEEGSSAQFIEMITGSPELYSRSVEVFVHEGAKATYSTVQDMKDGAFLSWKTATVMKDASFTWVDCILGSSLVHSNTRSILAGPGAMSNNHGLYCSSKSQQFDLGLDAVHAAPDTASDIKLKGALLDKSKALFRGLVEMQPPAARSNGYQKSDALILSDDAKADAIPNLEINTDEVKCSHGATIGKVSEEMEYYLMSRGIDKATVTRMIVQGFFEQIIAEVPGKDEQELIKNLIERKVQ
ncbi:SufD family Fe-S cluster assembly protein [Candidatus Woesearchaeota archaeon]|nr:MAG: Fe-S cluster assembly protein SufD [archaeon GW2011_AR4]MBS3130366.1 SufD family Fe-S cluster assembly protein [Candidatus Woesearchaeota archaeon]HIH38231.1 SufD family Fe-S cluster assembly protein [Candidatus Woesearchaeota archaeon]HIH49818.1 SufD family Fe-S cluster assembly protein [Candidatus Woesearchaeota archaeon]HIJ04183.1 SufD family Fe-S cluster assembly protein [Candidatus Woesearchaeota archaeon]